MSLFSVRRAALTALAATVGLAVPTGASAAISPANDPFYKAPADLASLAPGDVIRSRTTRVQPLPGLKLSYKTYQVLYRTTDTQDAPVATVATIMLPLKAPKTGRKLVSYQTAYDGLAAKCQPSYTMQTGKDPQGSAEILQMIAALSKGWTVVTADYEGPNNTWIAGKMAGQGVLDGIRAAEGFAPAGLDQGAATKVGLLGYSGGGHATAWANELAGTYAPELQIVGASQGGVPADPALLLGSLDGGPLAGVLLAAIVGLKEAYPNIDFDQYLNAKGRAAFVKLRRECIGEFAAQFPGAKVADYSTVPNILAVPEIKAIADANTLGQHVPAAPTLMYHAFKDELVGYPGAYNLSQRYCQMGAQLQFIRSNSGEHASLAVSFAGRAIAYLSQRFSGAPAANTCAAG